jgi:hypothetical protein
MGVVKNISITRFPKQGSFLGKKVEVCFHYDTSKTIKGIIVRDDSEEPWVTIIQLEQESGVKGPYVLATECQYALR